MMDIRTRLVTAVPSLALVVLLAACGGDTTAPEPPEAPADATASADDADAATDAADAFPLTLEYVNAGTTRTIQLAARPERIVSLSPSATEGLFAVGAGPQVIAADEYSDFPAEAPTTDLSGFTPNVEAIVAYDPDLVVVSYDPGDLVASLAAVGVPVLMLDAAVDLDDVMAQLGILGRVTGNSATAAGTVAALEARIDAAVAAVPDLDAPPTYLHVLDETLFTVTSSTFIGSVYALFGLENAADAADPDGEAFGYPQLSSEYLVESDPDLVFLASGGAATFAAIPGLGGLRAVTSDRVVELAPDVSSRWGPRVVDFVEQIAATVAALDAPVGTTP
jgi:iron complex transport system substrate-binding protein